MARRRDNFRLDPVISRRVLPSWLITKDLATIVAGDMAWSKEAMSESFFLTNMSPQVPALNRGMWRILEEQIRKWALKEQELYIMAPLSDLTTRLLALIK